jgi:hypothetical protein
MPLIRKGGSPKTIVANRANGRNGGHPLENVRNLQHGIFAAIDPFIMGELGEDPAEFARVREDILNSLALQDAMEQALAEQMVNLLWRHYRLQRGEAGQQAEQRRTLSCSASTSWPVKANTPPTRACRPSWLANWGSLGSQTPHSSSNMSSCSCATWRLQPLW